MATGASIQMTLQSVPALFLKMLLNLHRLARRLVILSLFSAFVFAQEPGTPGPQPVSSTVASAPVDSGIRASDPVPPVPALTPEDKHIFGVLPNYRTAEAAQVYTPISAKQKFIIATKDTLDGPGFVLAGAFAGLYQLENENPSFGQGFKGYAIRYATSYGDQAIGNMMTEGIMPSLLHEDPRYFRRGSGSVPGRTFYALSRVLVTRTDSGGTRFNFSEVLGNGVDAAVGNAYYPDERGFLDTMDRLGLSVGTDAVSDVLKEFWPDFKKHVLHRHSSPD